MPYTWDAGDEVIIYSMEDRPSFTSNTINIKDTNAVKGFCHLNSNKIYFSTKTIDELNIQALISENYLITASTNRLKLTVDAESKDIIFNIGNQTAQEIIDQINNVFYHEVASVYSGYIVLSGNYIKIEDTANSAHTVLGFLDREVFVSITGTSNNSIKFTAGDVTTLELNVDGNDYSIEFEKDITYSISQIIDLINQTVPNLAFNIKSSIRLLASNNIFIKNSVSKLDLSAQSRGLADYVLGEDNWEFNLELYESISNLKVAALDQLYKYTPEGTLEIIYKLEAPTLTTTTLDVEADLISLTGTYNEEAQQVLLNNEETTIASAGTWSLTLRDLSVGNNSVQVQLLDVFGGFSDPLDFVVNYNPPTNTLPTPSPTGPRWEEKDLFEIDPFRPIRDKIQPLIDFLDSIVATLKTISAVLEILKAFISSFANALIDLIQAILDQILSLIKDLAGGGVYVLSTFPGLQELKGNRELLDFFSGGYNGFVERVSSSFDDPLDSRSF